MPRNCVRFCLLMFGLALTGLTLIGSTVCSAADRPNVLFIAVDDLRPELGCYGKSHIHSPNIDALAKRGVLFERSYCMVPTCGASRASLMTGIRPTPDRFRNYLAWAEKDAPGLIPLHTQFKINGYTTASFGKILHHNSDSLDGWSLPPWRPRTSDWHDQPGMLQAIRQHKRNYPERTKIRGLPYESYDAPDTEYRDGEVATRAIEQLDQFANDASQPFFLAVGFFKPHLPFCAPKKYWDLYNADEIELAENNFAPQGAPEGAVHTSGELRSYASIPPKGPVSEATARKLVHGYYACVSFTDAQIGRVVDALEQKGLAENTIVVLWGDHGWQLGEHGMWNKHSCFETSMHAPLLICSADKRFQPGTRVSRLVEFIDIYPTLCDLSGIRGPPHLQGQSLTSLMQDPSSPWKEYAIGRYKSGDTIRSDTHRYSEYTGFDQQITGRMLYNHRVDPDENVNVATESQSVVDELSLQLNARKGKSPRAAANP